MNNEKEAKVIRFSLNFQRSVRGRPKKTQGHLIPDIKYKNMTVRVET
jgi:hypothetical protein